MLLAIRENHTRISCTFVANFCNVSQALIPKLGKLIPSGHLGKINTSSCVRSKSKEIEIKKLLGEAKRCNLRKQKKLWQFFLQMCWVIILNSLLILQLVMSTSQYSSSSEDSSHQKGQCIALQGCLLVSCQMNQSFCSKKHYQVIWGAAAPKAASLLTFLLHCSVLILLVVSACYILEELK